MKEKLKEFIQLVKDNKKLAILSLVMLLTVIGGMAYAIFNYAFTGNQSTISVGPLSVTYLEGTNKVNITNALPISDETGKESNSFDFVVKSNTSRNTNIVYTISLEKLSSSSGYTSLNDSDIDIYLTSENKILKNVTKVSELNNNELYRTTHVHNSTNREVQTKYSLRAWIDSGVDASSWNSSTKLEYKFRVNVQTLEVAPATQSVTSGQATNLNISNLGISANIPANSVSASSVTLNAYPGGETFNISTEESTLSYEINLTDANGNDVTSTSPIAVQINIGTGLEVKSMMHGSTSMTKASSHAADTYEYDSSTGILTMYVTHFSEFKINVKQRAVPGPVSFATDSWETIVAAVKSGNTSKYNVGDTKEIDMGIYNVFAYTVNYEPCMDTLDTFSPLYPEWPVEVVESILQSACRRPSPSFSNPLGPTSLFKGLYTEDELIEMGVLTKTLIPHTVRIANKSTPSECSEENFSETACGFVIEFADIITTYRMNDTATNAGGWSATQMRPFVNNDIYNALPSTLKEGIIDTKVISGHGSNDSSNFTSTDKLYLLSTHEVWKDADGNTSSGIDYYDTAYNNTRQLDYYSNLNVTTNNYSAAVKKSRGSDSDWWLRSSSILDECSFRYVMRPGSPSAAYANDSVVVTDDGISPAFRLG